MSRASVPLLPEAPVRAVSATVSMLRSCGFEASARPMATPPMLDIVAPSRKQLQIAVQVVFGLDICDVAELRRMPIVDLLQPISLEVH